MGIKKERNFWRLLVISLCLTGIAYGIFLRMHYSLDSYSVYFEKNADIHIKNARYLNYILGSILLKFNINTVVYQSLFTSVLIIGIAWSITRLTYFCDVLLNPNDILFKRILIFIMISLGFINVFMIEWFLYPEITLYYSLSLFFAVEAVLVLIKKQIFKNYLISFALLELSLFSYQAAMPVFVIFYLSCLILKCNFNVKKNEIVAGIGGIGVGFFGSISVIVFQKIANIGDSRTASLGLWRILSNIKQLVVFQKQLWFDQMGFLPEFFLVVLILMVVAILFKSLKKNTFSNIFFIVVILVINYLIIFAPHLVSEALWLPERTIVAFWCFIATIGLMAMQLNENKGDEYFLGFCFFCILTINIIGIQRIFDNHIRSNEKDQQYVVEIQEKIEDYEKHNNVEITSIATCRDEVYEYCYPDIKYVYCDTNTKCFSVDWGDVTAINYFTFENYKKVNMDKNVYEKYFKGKNWDSFNSSEQMVFVGDTLYLCFY